MPTADDLILTNGPGEVATWVRPVVAQLHTLWGSALRISVVLSPCPHSTGAETHILQQMPGVARVQAAKDFWPFLLWGRTAQGWDWLPRGVVLFLGGGPRSIPWCVAAGWVMPLWPMRRCRCAGLVGLRRWLWQKNTC